MTVFVLADVVRAASGRITAALAARYRDLDIAEEALAEATARAVETIAAGQVLADPAGWLYRAADRCALDMLRRRAIRERLAPPEPLPEPSVEDRLTGDEAIIPDERLRLIFVCCHPAIAAETRAALTLRLVCGLSTAQIAHAFLIAEPALAQRLTRAKRKIAEAGVAFEVPPPEGWAERLEAVLSTLEVAYAKAHEDAAGTGSHAGHAGEVRRLTRLLADLLPAEGEVLALAALVRLAEARRPARLGADGRMVPLAEQDPARWTPSLIADAGQFLEAATALPARGPRYFQAMIHAAWCARRSLADPAPWPRVLALYDELLQWRDDVVVRLNRIVALAEVAGVAVALGELATLEATGAGRGVQLAGFLPYQALRADLSRRAGKLEAAADAYRTALSLGPAEAERDFLAERLAALRPSG